MIHLQVHLQVHRGTIIFALMALAGCNTVVTNRSADITAQQSHLIVVSTLLMLLIIIPVVALIVLFAWRYRKNNTAAACAPTCDHSTRLDPPRTGDLGRAPDDHQEQGVIDFNNNHLVDALTWYAPVLMVAVAWVTPVRHAPSVRRAGGIEGEGLDALNG